MNKNLAKEYREVMGAAKMAYVKFFMTSGVMSEMDSDNVSQMMELAQITNRLLNLSCDMLEQNEAMMTKFDKCMDKYLET